MTVVRKPRPRRIAADEAHAWARNLRLGNSLAKLVLSMCTLYVDGEGRCFPGIESLAEDTELSIDTVRKRLAFLEQVGAIARFPQWVDENGRRNGDGRGKRTSDEIRLLMDADPDEIEHRAKGNGDGDGVPDVPVSGPSPQQGLNEPQDSVSPLPALGQPSDSGEGLDSLNREPEVTPNPLSGGVRADVDQELEADIARFRERYPSPITNLPRLRTLLSAMSGPERTRILTAVDGYASFIAACDRKGKPRSVKDADRWVSHGLWEGYVATGEQAQAMALRQSVSTDSDVGKAWATIHKIAGMTPFQSQGQYSLPRPLAPQELALANAPSDFREWKFIPVDERQKTKAWDDLIAHALKGKPRVPLVNERNAGRGRGFMAPWDWPPRVDGSLCTGPPIPDKAAS